MTKALGPVALLAAVSKPLAKLVHALTGASARATARVLVMTYTVLLPITAALAEPDDAGAIVLLGVISIGFGLVIRWVLCREADKAKHGAPEGAVRTLVPMHATIQSCLAVYHLVRDLALHAAADTLLVTATATTARVAMLLAIGLLWCDEPTGKTVWQRIGEFLSERSQVPVPSGA